MDPCLEKDPVQEIEDLRTQLAMMQNKYEALRTTIRSLSEGCRQAHEDLPGRIVLVDVVTLAERLDSALAYDVTTEDEMQRTQRRQSNIIETMKSGNFSISLLHLAFTRKTDVASTTSEPST